MYSGFAGICFSFVFRAVNRFVSGFIVCKPLRFLGTGVCQMLLIPTDIASLLRFAIHSSFALWNSVLCYIANLFLILFHEVNQLT